MMSARSKLAKCPLIGEFWTKSRANVYAGRPVRSRRGDSVVKFHLALRGMLAQVFFCVCVWLGPSSSCTTTTVCCVLPAPSLQISRVKGFGAIRTSFLENLAFFVSVESLFLADKVDSRRCFKWGGHRNVLAIDSCKIESRGSCGWPFWAPKSTATMLRLDLM
jgi:hypothetical protein